MLITSFRSLTRSAPVRQRRNKPRRKSLSRGHVSLEALEQRTLLSNSPLAEVEENDGAGTAQALPLGFDAGEQAQLVVSGSIDAGDQDWYALQLNAGDVLGVTVQGNNQLDATLSLLNSDEELLIYNNNHRYIAHNFYVPHDSPLPTLNSENSEDSLIQYVIGSSGTYFLKVAANAGTTGGYKMTSVVARPGPESEPAGARQIIFVDFDGAKVNMSEFFNGTTTGQTTLSPLSRFLPLWGLDADDGDLLMDEIMSNIRKDFQNVLDSGVNPNADVTILDSRYDADDYGENPYVSRLIIGGTQEEASVEEFNVPIFAFAQHIDVGNYDFGDQAIVLLDEFSGMIPGDFNYAFDLNRVPMANNTKTLKIEMLGKAIGNVGSHEIGHNLGNYHTDSVRLAHLNPGIMDNGDPRGFHAAAPGVGDDGIYGTTDDEDRDFITDVYHPGEPFEGVGANNTLAITAFALSTGQGINATTVSSGFTGLTTFGDDTDESLIDELFTV
jgi:hypothetical protein